MLQRCAIVTDRLFSFQLQNAPDNILSPEYRKITMIVFLLILFYAIEHAQLSLQNTNGDNIRLYIRKASHDAPK